MSLLVRQTGVREACDLRLKLKMESLKLHQNGQRRECCEQYLIELVQQIIPTALAIQPIRIMNQPKLDRHRRDACLGLGLLLGEPHGC